MRSSVNFTLGDSSSDGVVRSRGRWRDAPGPGGQWLEVAQTLELEGNHGENNTGRGAAIRSSAGRDLVTAAQRPLTEHERSNILDRVLNEKLNTPTGHSYRTRSWGNRVWVPYGYPRLRNRGTTWAEAGTINGPSGIPE